MSGVHGRGATPPVARRPQGQVGGFRSRPRHTLALTPRMVPMGGLGGSSGSANPGFVAASDPRAGSPLVPGTLVGRSTWNIGTGPRVPVGFGGWGQAALWLMAALPAASRWQNLRIRRSAASAGQGDRGLQEGSRRRQAGRPHLCPGRAGGMFHVEHWLPDVGG